MRRWFGQASFTNEYMRQEVGRVLNSIANVLSNVDYVAHELGEDCSENTFAYVLPYGDDEDSRSSDGAYVFHLCPLYFDSRVSVQVETLTHEASHHSTAYTKDVCIDREASYFEEPVSNFGLDSHDVSSIRALIGKAFSIDDGTPPAIAEVMLIKGDMVLMQEVAMEEYQECQSVAYSREICKQLASDDPIRAVRNADNFCYYIQDITDLDAGAPTAPSNTKDFLMPTLYPQSFF